MADAESSPHLFTTPADTVARVSKEKTGSRDFQWTLDQQPMYFQWHALNSVKLYRYRPSSQFSFCIKNYVTVSVQLLFHQLWNWKTSKYFPLISCEYEATISDRRMLLHFFRYVINWKLSSFSPYNIFLQAAREINTKREISPKVDLIPSQDFFHSRRNSIFKLVKRLLLLFSLSLPQKRFE